MHVDKYTKAVLTVIAVCLIWLSLGGPALLPAAHAQSPKSLATQHVLIAGWIDSHGTVRDLVSPTGEHAPKDSGLPVAITPAR